MAATPTQGPGLKRSLPVWQAVGLTAAEGIAAEEYTTNGGVTAAEDISAAEAS